eukprot:gene17977-biopygen846
MAPRCANLRRWRCGDGGGSRGFPGRVVHDTRRGGVQKPRKECNPSQQRHCWDSEIVAAISYFGKHRKAGIGHTTTTGVPATPPVVPPPQLCGMVIPPNQTTLWGGGWIDRTLTVRCRFFRAWAGISAPSAPTVRIRNSTANCRASAPPPRGAWRRRRRATSPGGARRTAGEAVGGTAAAAAGVGTAAAAAEGSSCNSSNIRTQRKMLTARAAAAAVGAAEAA